MRLLVSARDPGAALSIFEVIKQIKYFQQITLSVFAMEPALGILQGLGVQVNKVDCKPATSGNSENSLHLQREATSILAKNKPDALLVGLSGPDAGIDEALLLQARETHLPTYAIQDFWGDVNLTFEQPADTYFVLDDSAGELTRKKVNTKIVVVGSLKHSSYHLIDIEGLRSQSHNQIPCQEGDHVITFCGQPLWHVESYRENLEKLALVVSESNQDTILLYKPHPKETIQDAAMALEILKKHHRNSKLGKKLTTEILLARSDLLCSSFSLTGLDQVFLNRAASKPLGITAFVLMVEGLLEWYQNFTKHDEAMPGMKEFAEVVLNQKGLRTSIDHSRNPAYRHQRRLNIIEKLPDPTDSSKLVVSHILNELQK